MDYLLGIDSGLTWTKAVLFDRSGRQICVARQRVPQIMPRARFVERDMNALWQQTSAAIRNVVEASGISPKDIAGVAATAHGDGVYVLDASNEPLGNGILSLDSRAFDVVARWSAEGVDEKSLPLTGQVPHPSAPSAILRWIKENEPERYSKIATVLACKDWLRYCLTGTVGTDRTEASISFTDVRTQEFSDEAMELFGLKDLIPALPAISHSSEIVGHVTAQAAGMTGLSEGTPVASGLHDVTASVLGIGAHREGVVGVVAGTYSINEVVSRNPKTDRRWFCRSAIEPGVWNNMSVSPSSTANYDWFLDTFFAADQQKAESDGQSIHALLSSEIESALRRPSSVIYHPFLFGSPHSDTASAGMLGLRGWHARGDVIASVLEGIAFNHRTHIDALRSGFETTSVVLTGGASRNPTFAQLFADIVGMNVTVTETDEAAAWGTAMCAGAAVGMFDSADADPRDLASISTQYTPDSSRNAHYDQRYQIYLEAVETLGSLWEKLDKLGQTDRLC